MLSAAKHLHTQRNRPFAALRVTPAGSSIHWLFPIEPQHCHPEAKSKRKGDQVVLASLLPADGARFGSRGVSAFDTRNPVTAPITITGNRSGCPPSSPSRRVTVKGR